MRRLVGSVAGLFAALLLILFAVSNRAPVELKLEPLPYVLDLPLYALLLGTLVLGFLLGAVAAFFASQRTRRRARRAEAEAARLEAALRQARAELDKRLAAEAALARSAKGLPAPPGALPRSLPKAS